MSGGYPPGVTGNEPHITGEIEYDPHAPYWVGELNPGVPEEGWAIFWADTEEPYFDDFKTERQAELLAKIMNRHWTEREQDPDEDGLCRVCNDYHGMPPGMEE